MFPRARPRNAADIEPVRPAGSHGVGGCQDGASREVVAEGRSLVLVDRPERRWVVLGHVEDDGALEDLPDEDRRGRQRQVADDDRVAASNRVDFTSWAAVPWTRWLSTSARVGVSWWGNYGGDEDRPPPPTVIPTADPNRRAGHRVELLGGINLDLPLGGLGRHRFAIEAGGPVYPWLDGPQLESDGRGLVGGQKAVF